MLPVGLCQVPPPLRPLQVETTVVGSQQGLRCGSICPVTTGQESVVNRCATSPHSVQISHPRRQGPSTQEPILSDHPQQCTVLPRCCLSGSPWRLAWHQKSSGSMPFEYAVDGSTSQTHTGSDSTLLNALTGKCKHLIPNTHRGWTGHCSNNQKNVWKDMQILIQSCHSVNIDLSCDVSAKCYFIYNRGLSATVHCMHFLCISHMKLCSLFFQFFIIMYIICIWIWDPLYLSMYFGSLQFIIIILLYIHFNRAGQNHSCQSTNGYFTLPIKITLIPSSVT